MANLLSFAAAADRFTASFEHVFKYADLLSLSQSVMSWADRRGRPGKPPFCQIVSSKMHS
jgi:hypothetical protein